MDGENDHESNYTKLDIALGVQAAFEICATCHGLIEQRKLKVGRVYVERAEA